MKNNLFLAGILAIALVSCNSKEQKTEEIIVEDTIISTEFVDEHTAQNSLDWDGTYQGTLPCADCEGIITTIILNSDGTFSSKEEYQKEPILIIENKGNFVWDNSGLIVALKGESGDYKRSFKVVENAIIHLDNEENEITGELAELYRLTKQ